MAKTGLGLGKGLGALLSEAEHETGNDISAVSVVQNGGDTLLDITKLKPNPHQPRTEFDQDALEELANSIREHGVIQPVLVEKVDDNIYYIIAGERRTRAAKLAGLKEIPVRIKAFSEERKLEVALIENVQREDLNPLEEAIAYKKLMEMSSITQEEVARRVGKNRSTVANALRLLKLPEDMQNSLSKEEITAGHARALLSITNPSDQRILFGRIIGQGLSVRESEKQAIELNNGSRVTTVSKTNNKPQEVKDPDIVYFEQQLIEVLGTKVSLKGSFDKGSIQIEYFNKEDLDRVFSLIVK